ncbi:hypothetical protein ASPVEDRAFT_86691 [Aspergillus versicolor CBS 583.65]|uniref:AB hydrolase-1 domain-containing protein n=1 Tax=Aspergillus versicolor CBS 583.65 TaxID=1036611 RepID=A0A1L9PV82_ASPVE|nr:uncharacterized protein ASPVEDRAFT_86691 [Aspergillus versicolor CBS 583.65]OJJ05336.1 hypothetical protein ASPVEDRAFT_86691 [Aspergillus versicolor CBS 583.65]
MRSVTSSALLRESRLVPAAHPRALSTVKSPDDRLFVSVNEYRPETATSGVTLLLTHGTSFCKELWEPLIEFWLREGGPLRISAVFALDAVNHGDSAVANEKQLGSSTYWPDHSRDILKVLDHLGATRPLIGIGHSFGGGTLAHASLMQPLRFDATILVEPVLFQMREQTAAISRQALKRRDTWENLEETYTAISGSKGFSDWTTDQRERYAVYATRDRTSDCGVVRTLKTTKEQESATYLAAPYPTIIDLLSASREPRYYILGERSPVLNKDCQAAVEKMAQIHGDVKYIQDGGHLLPMTHPIELGVILEQTIITAMSKIGTVRCHF